jgi:hypothetical protein
MPLLSRDRGERHEFKDPAAVANACRREAGWRPPAPTVAATASECAPGRQRSRSNTVHSRAGHWSRTSTIDELKLKAPIDRRLNHQARRRPGREHIAVRDLLE